MEKDASRCCENEKSAADDQSTRALRVKISVIEAYEAGDSDLIRMP